MAACRYLEGENINPVTAAEARKLIGKRVQYLRTGDIDRSGRGYISPQEGEIKDVVGRNIQINSDWQWRPSIVEMKLLP